MFSCEYCETFKNIDFEEHCERLLLSVVLNTVQTKQFLKIRQFFIELIKENFIQMIKQNYMVGDFAKFKISYLQN